MFAKKGPVTIDNVETFIGLKTSIKGNLVSEGSIRIDGKVTGDVKAGGDIFNGEKSEVKGNIDCGNITVSGIIKGNINASGILKIHSKAKIFGDIQVLSLVTDEGGILQGKCTTTAIEETAPETDEEISEKE